MKKLELNKTTISEMNKNQLSRITGGLFGICLKSCANGSRKGKKCCDNDSLDGDYDDLGGIA